MSPPAEFENLVRAHSPTLRRYCVRLAGASDGDDLLQETLARAMVRFGTLRDRERFVPWCRQIARTTHLRRLQRARTTEPIVELAGEGDLEAEVVDALVHRAEVAAVLAGLNERNRRVLTARADGVPPAELASQLGVSRQLVDTWFARSRLQARNLLRSLRETGTASSVGVAVMRWVRRYAWIGGIAVGAGVAVTLVAPWRASPPIRLGRPPAAASAGGRVTPPAARAASTPPAVDVARRPAGWWSTAPTLPAAARTAATPPRETLALPHGERAPVIDAAAAAEPIVIGPLLPGNAVIIGFDPCAYVELVTPCSPIVRGIRAHIR